MESQGDGEGHFTAFSPIAGIATIQTFKTISSVATVPTFKAINAIWWLGAGIVLRLARVVKF